MKGHFKQETLDSPNWTFAIVVLLYFIFLFPFLYQRFNSGVFELSGWTVGENQLNRQFALHPAVSSSADKRVATRQQRIIFPLVVYLAAFGSPVFIPVLLILVNYVALCVMGWLSGMYAQSLGRSALWGLMLPLYSGFLFSLRANSPEIVEICLLLGFLLCLLRKRYVVATVLLSLAALTKETALLIVMALAITYFKQATVRDTIKWFHFTVPFVVFVIWQTILFLVWGSLPLRLSQRELGLPLAGIGRLSCGALQTRPISVLMLFTLIGFTATTALAFVAAIDLKRDSNSRLQGFEIYAFGLYTLWAFSLNGYLFNYEFDFLRALAEFYLIACVGLFQTKGYGRIAVGSAMVILWISFALRMANELGVV